MGYDKNIEDDDSKMSRINSAGLINATLERLWIDCYAAMAKGEYSLWNIKLDSIWCILGGDAIEDDDNDKKMNKIDLELYALGSLKSKTGVGFSKVENPNNAEKYQMLKKKSLFLRRLQNSQGKGTAYTSDDDDDID
jgi:hypothetical protein